MTKIKKMIAATVAAVSMGAIGMTAFAADNVKLGYKFALKFDAHEENVFTLYSAIKRDSPEDPAVVEIESGAQLFNAVYFSVWDSADELYGYRLTKVVPVNTNHDQKEIPYTSSSTTVENTKTFYLNAYAGVNMDISGVWAP